ncbi:Glycosyltransferase involved in cell wall bisynthesis [Salinimicrobium catena]|uniref:Glycosyltransferase involved in cell wall bisynthesis n=1 Tax=Salinimicrobium catena TaxID=390640 RepID=A0A1H5LMJ8_9FLAO|nr:glycosyltransferase [Salinimicrobium catena]SDL10977.1 Glycosyltransferase involved in cell wall bisynthesis [Salinimicrobium catena]SEE77418.1 Glycosyltransferase involved in cell wall bisynthesis [Salinimicrobium catena]
MIDLISVIIPTYNRHHIILDAIKSVENQTYKNWELIVVDDCSTDQTQELLEGRKGLKFIKLPENKGNAGARNEGVKNASGKYIVFLDSDDQMEVNCLELFSELLKNKPETKFAFGGYYILNKETGTKNKKMWKPDPSKSFLRELKIGTGCGLLVQKECFEKIGFFDERLRVAVDTDWLIRLEKEFSYEVIDECLVTVVKHQGERVRNDKSKLLKSYEIILEKNKKDIYSDPSILFKFLYKLQWLNYQSGNLGNGNKFLLRQLKHGVFKLKAFYSFILYNFLPTNIARNIHNKLSGSTI